MRRKDREITKRAEMEAILNEALVCRIGLAVGEDPYVIPVCFGYENGSVFVHSAKKGKKIGILRKNPRCCVEVDITPGPIPSDDPCSWEMRYRSVVCQGTAHFVEDDTGKQAALDCIVRHYGAKPQPINAAALGRLCIIRIDIEEMTGKKNGYQDQGGGGGSEGAGAHR